MALLIELCSDNELISYEGCTLALTLATFGHSVQLYLDAPVFGLLMQPASRLHGMIKSLDLYDMPPAWLPQDVFGGWLTGMLPDELKQQITSAPDTIAITDFEQVLRF